MNSVVQNYIAGSASLDPIFVGLRRKFFNPNGSWIEVCDAVFGTASQKMGPIGVKALTPAFGWELRPWTQSSVITKESLSICIDELNGRKDWDTGQINCVSADEAKLISDCFKLKGNSVAVFPFPVRVVAGIPDYASYLKSRSASANKNQRRYMKKALAEGYHFETKPITWTQAERVLNSRNTSFSETGDYTQSPEFRAFFEPFLVQMRLTGRLLEVGMYKGEMLVGYVIGFWNGSVIHCYQTAFDPAHADARPGALTIEKFIEVALGMNAQVIDFMGDNPYLDLFSKEILPLKRLVFFSRSLKGRLLSLSFKIKNR